jgi:hypothetical protein
MPPEAAALFFVGLVSDVFLTTLETIFSLAAGLSCAGAQ